MSLSLVLSQYVYAVYLLLVLYYLKLILKRFILHIRVVITPLFRYCLTNCTSVISLFYRLNPCLPSQYRYDLHLFRVAYTVTICGGV